MPYQFDINVLSLIQDAFITAVVYDESVEQSDLNHRDYFFLEFCIQPAIEYIEAKQPTAVDALLNGDKKLTLHCNEALHSLATVELGFRWTGMTACLQSILLLGFCAKIIYTDDKNKLRNRVMDCLCNIMKNANVLPPHHSLAANCHFLKSKIKKCSFFQSLPRAHYLNSSVIACVKDYIALHIPPIMPAYVRENEQGINPLYQNIDSINTPLKLNQKKIWLFRGDFILAVGNKNAYWTTFSENGLAEEIDPALHHFVNWEDRYGHPSLACSYANYHGSAFYGGLLIQRIGYLELYISSGRYFRNDLPETEKKIMEAYIAYQLQQAYGAQLIIFRDAPGSKDYFECSIFYANHELPVYCQKREYTQEKIVDIFTKMTKKSDPVLKM